MAVDVIKVNINLGPVEVNIEKLPRSDARTLTMYVTSIDPDWVAANPGASIEELAAASRVPFDLTDHTVTAKIYESADVGSAEVDDLSAEISTDPTEGAVSVTFQVTADFVEQTHWRCWLTPDGGQPFTIARGKLKVEGPGGEV